MSQQYASEYERLLQFADSQWKGSKFYQSYTRKIMQDHAVELAAMAGRIPRRERRVRIKAKTRKATE